jgi:hypothetical protein
MNKFPLFTFYICQKSQRRNRKEKKVNKGGRKWEWKEGIEYGEDDDNGENGKSEDNNEKMKKLVSF